MSEMKSVDLRSAKATNKGDLLMVMYMDGYIKLYEVMERVGLRGRMGKTNLSLRNVVTDRVTNVSISTELPHDWKMVRRVSKGINQRTLDRIAAECKMAAEAGATSAEEIPPVLDPTVNDGD